MPKIIENLDEIITDAGKSILMENGYQALTMREVARRSEVGLGTVYNYVSNKEELVARIMIKDWIILFKNRTCEGTSCLEELEKIYLNISDFADIYRFIWMEYNASMAITNTRHATLIKQIHEIVIEIFKKYQINDFNNESVFISEVILNSAVRDDVEFDMIRPFIEKIIN